MVEVREGQDGMKTKHDGRMQWVDFSLTAFLSESLFLVIVLGDHARSVAPVLGLKEAGIAVQVDHVSGSIFFECVVQLMVPQAAATS